MPKRRNVIGVGKAHETNECCHCSYEVSSKTGMRLHLKMKHSVDMSNSGDIKCCYTCGRIFENSKKLIHHMRKECY